MFLLRRLFVASSKRSPIRDHRASSGFAASDLALGWGRARATSPWAPSNLRPVPPQLTAEAYVALVAIGEHWVVLKLQWRRPFWDLHFIHARPRVAEGALMPIIQALSGASVAASRAPSSRPPHTGPVNSGRIHPSCACQRKLMDSLCVGPFCFGCWHSESTSGIP